MAKPKSETTTTAGGSGGDPSEIMLREDLLTAAPQPLESPSPALGVVPMMFVSAEVDGYAPAARVLVQKGRHQYTLLETAALVSCGLGTVSTADRETLEALGLLPTTSPLASGGVD